MLKILAAGDFHNDHLCATRLAERATKENVDLIILNGDLVEEDQPHGIIGHFVNTKKKLVLVPGNHDLLATEFLANLYGVKNLHGAYMIQNGIGICGFGGANCGMNALSEEDIYAELKASFEQIKHLSTTIMVTHVHPSGTHMEQFSSFIKGSIGLRKAIESCKPTVVICGHVHEAEGIEEKIGSTTVINVGKSGKTLTL